MISILMHVLVRGERTGGAWWPICPNIVSYSFDDNIEYKIFGVIYSADTTAFREMWYKAKVQSTWDAICK